MYGAQTTDKPCDDGRPFAFGVRLRSTAGKISAGFSWWEAHVVDVTF